MAIISVLAGLFILSYVLFVSGDMLTAVLDDPSKPPFMYYIYMMGLHIVAALLGGWATTALNRKSGKRSLIWLLGLTVGFALYNAAVTYGQTPLWFQLLNLLGIALGIWLASFGIKSSKGG